MSEKLTLEEWRRLRGYSNQYMAERLGVHLNTYRAWEDKPSDIKLAKAHQIAEILDVAVSDIAFLP